jgi:cyclic pyranopterin phosphate synthase
METKSKVKIKGGIRMVILKEEERKKMKKRKTRENEAKIKMEKGQKDLSSGQIKSKKIKMVDVAEKPETLRTARARGEVKMSAEVLRMILENRLPKGDVLAAARLAGIQAAKKTSELIPLCHPLRITSVDVEVLPNETENFVEVRGLVRAMDRTGVEMEALTAVSLACLTVYDMCKAFDRRMVISNIHLVSKTGGKSGDFRW